MKSSLAQSIIHEKSLDFLNEMVFGKQRAPFFFNRLMPIFHQEIKSSSFYRRFCIAFLPMNFVDEPLLTVAPKCIVHDLYYMVPIESFRNTNCDHNVPKWPSLCSVHPHKQMLNVIQDTDFKGLEYFYKYQPQDFQKMISQCVIFKRYRSLIHLILICKRDQHYKVIAKMLSMLSSLDISMIILLEIASIIPMQWLCKLKRLNPHKFSDSFFFVSYVTCALKNDNKRLTCLIKAIKNNLHRRKILVRFGQKSITYEPHWIRDILFTETPLPKDLCILASTLNYVKS